MKTTTSESVDLLIEAHWIATVEPEQILRNHAVVINDGRIKAILPNAAARLRFTPRTHTVLKHHLLIPGLINLHTHAAMTLMRGMADDLPLMTWLKEHIWPAEGQLMSPEFALTGSRLACAEMLLGGVTCFNDMYFYPEATASAAVEYGMRAMLGITALEFPTPYASDATDYLTKGLAVRETWLKHPLIGFTLSPHAPYTVSDPTFERIQTLAGQLNLPVQCHLHETGQEIEDSLARHGERPIARLKRLGLLGPGFIGIHATHLNDDDRQTLADTGSHIAHCPTSNLKLASGLPDVARMRQAGINVGLGTDGAASNNRLDVLGEMRLASLLAKGLSGDATALGCGEVLRMATLGAAQALGLADEIGSLAPGKAADICAISLGNLFCQPCFDPISHLINVAGREAVTHVWIAGKCCVDNKKLVHKPENDLESAIALWQNRLEFRQPGQPFKP